MICVGFYECTGDAQSTGDDQSTGGYPECIGGVQCTGGYQQCIGEILVLLWSIPNALIISSTQIMIPLMH